ncbi:MAG: YhdP family protein, partial [Burkholderiales bacterium]
KYIDLAVDSSLQGMAITLPPPFAKGEHEAMPVHLERKGGNGDAYTAFKYADRVHARFQAAPTGKARGLISIGQTLGALPVSGVRIVGELEHIDFDLWRRILLKPESKTPLGLDGVDVRVGVLDLYGHRFDKLGINAVRHGSAWRINLSGDGLNGVMQWNRGGSGKINGRFKTLALNGNPARRPEQSAKTPQAMPALDIVADSLTLKGKHLGKLELQAFEQNNDWHIEALKLVSSASVLEVDGLWRDWNRNPVTELNLKLTVDNVGKLLTILGYNNSIKNGTGLLEGRAMWAGPLYDIDYPSLAGTLKLEVEDGQFLQIDPGVGKLLSILSLQNLPRRVSLDFRDVFSSGFAFDKISSAIEIANGIAASDDFVMQGPAAHVVITGSTDLDVETQDLQVTVVPNVGESFAVVSAFAGGPAVGLTALLLQKLLENPLDKVTTFHYRVQGTWNDPQVSKLDKPVTKG